MKLGACSMMRALCGKGDTNDKMAPVRLGIRGKEACVM